MAIIRAPKKSKWYVVWIGHAPGIYPSWDKCRPQVEGFPGARFRAYDTLSEARVAFEAGPPRIGGHKAATPATETSAESETSSKAPAKASTAQAGTRKVASKKSATPATKAVTAKAPRGPIVPCVCVDAACNMDTRVMEYRGVDPATGVEIFRMGPYKGATNNMGEFLALVHAMSLLVKEGKSLPIYSDSTTALAWVRNKRAKTTVEQTAQNRKVFSLIARAEEWLNNNTVAVRVLKWDTAKWGENPADFGRK